VGLHALAALPPGKMLLVPIAVIGYLFFRIFSLVQVLFVKKNSDKNATHLKLFDICSKIC